MPSDLFTVFIVVLNCPPWNTASPKEAAEVNIEILMNKPPFRPSEWCSQRSYIKHVPGVARGLMPHGIQHEFGQSTLAGVFPNIGMLKTMFSRSLQRRTCSR